MPVAVPIHAIALAPGSSISIPDVSWQDFEGILADLGENRNTRLAYYRGTLEIVAPLALHERPHRIIADIIKALLDLQNRSWEDFGSTTLRRPEVAGVEPDTCFYIQSADLVRGCVDLDLTSYPPPDLAIESDVTSKTALSAYQALGVGEVWVYRNGQLKIYLFSDRGYVEISTSPTFPELPLTTLIPQLVRQAIERGTSQMLRQIRTNFPFPNSGS